jgi:molybdate transport system substrate-binding protein
MRVLAIVFGLALLVAPAQAGTVRVAVAANFSEAAEYVGEAFASATGHEVVFSFGATGALYVQITQGAPFDVFLAADGNRPAQAVREGFGVEGSIFTYAAGALVLYGPGLDLRKGEAVLAAGNFQHVAVADPASAPYGAAAVAVIETLGMTSQLMPKLVVGESVAQTMQFVASGNAELGFVALSQTITMKAVQLFPEPENWSRDVWLVPTELYPPIRQDAVLLRDGADNLAAIAFLDFLRNARLAKEIIENSGYAVVE